MAVRFNCHVFSTRPYLCSWWKRDPYISHTTFFLPPVPIERQKIFQILSLLKPRTRRRRVVTRKITQRRTLPKHVPSYRVHRAYPSRVHSSSILYSRRHYEPCILATNPLNHWPSQRFDLGRTSKTRRPIEDPQQVYQRLHVRVESLRRHTGRTVHACPKLPYPGRASFVVE